LGDDLYGPASMRNAAPRLALHAHRVTFPHPATGVKLDVQAAWPGDLKGILRRLGLKRPDLEPSEATKGAASERLRAAPGQDE
jgi:23S rRNA pseudouridine1911/1915/1917 synthase